MVSRFLDITSININNKNIAVLQEYLYRLYKDSKFFYELKNYIDESNYRYTDFIEAAEKIK